MSIGTRTIQISKTRQGLFLVALLLMLPFFTLSRSHAADPPVKVLIMMPDDPYLPSITVMNEAIRSTLRNGLPDRVQFYYEALENSRIPDEKYESEFVNLLRQKYADEKIDLSIALSTPAIRFLVKHRESLFSATPIVYMIPNPTRIADLDLGSFATGVLGETEPTRTLDLALSLQPETKRVVLIAGNAPLDKVRLEQARKEFAAYESRVEFVYLTDRTLQEFQKEVAALTPGTIVFHSSILMDSGGSSYSSPEAAAILSKSSSVPVYGTSQLMMGGGIVGGHLIDYESLGVGTAEIGLRVLAGENPGKIPVKKFESVPMFDSNELRRWNISEEALPAGSIVRFKEPTAWEQYKWQIIGLVIFSIFQSFLIGLLLFIRERRKKAEAESQRFAALAKAEHKRLDDVVSNVPGIVWESRLEPGADGRTTRYVSDYAEKMLGYSVEEWKSTPHFLLTIVLDEDRERVANEIQEIFGGGKQGVLQFRWVAKDGSVFWAEAHLAVISDENGTPVGLRGVTMDVTERKNAEEKLRVSELELIEAQRLSHIGSWEWDPQTDTVNWTEELYRIAGLDPSQPAPNLQQHEHFYTPESYKLLTSTVVRALNTGEAYELELEMIRTDKRHVWTSARGEVICDNDQKIIRLRGTLQDITARKEAEEALIESEERYRDVVETQTELICRYLPDTTLTFVNDAYCRYFEKAREELIGTKFVDLMPSHARDTMLNHVASLIESPRTEIYEHEVIRPNGIRGWQQWVDHAVETMNGNPRELQGIGRDITEKRQAEEELRVSENRFRTMADSAPLLIWMCGPDKLCNYVNQGWLDFTGRSIDIELGSGWTVGIHSEDSGRILEAFDSAFDLREPFKLEYRLRSADGVYRWVYDSGTPRFSSDGEFLGYIGSCVDISERKEAEEALQKAHEEVSQLQKQLHEENIYLKEVIKLEGTFEEIIGHSDALKYVLFKIEQVAPTDATVLITGETGTGKELVARAIHSTSLRKSRPLVKVNCAALSASLIESELFGHERGAFTGASARKIGRFELADGATIFLDEVGELPLELQSKLLRVIQEGEFERLGSSKTMKVDVRIIAATNRHLESQVKKRAFREDLLFRLNVFPITVPPLRERKDDIPELIEHFVSRFSKKIGKNIRSVSPATVRTLCKHSWPGNVRELANVIERSVINTQTENLQVLENFEASSGVSGSSASIDTLEDVERKYITQVLDNSGWKIEGSKGAAQILGLNPSTLRTRIAKLGISKPKSDERHLVGTSRS